MTAAVITDHVWRPRPAANGGTAGQEATGRRGSASIPARGCWYLARCGRPAGEHITPSEYRRRREARPA